MNSTTLVELPLSANKERCIFASERLPSSAVNLPFPTHDPRLSIHSRISVGGKDDAHTIGECAKTTSICGGALLSTIRTPYVASPNKTAQDQQHALAPATL